MTPSEFRLIFFLIFVLILSVSDQLSHPNGSKFFTLHFLRTWLVVASAVSSATVAGILVLHTAALHVGSELEADVAEHGGGVVEDLLLRLYDGGHAVDHAGTLHVDDTLEHGHGLGLEVHAALLHQRGSAARLSVAGGAGYADLEDADALELHLLTQLKVVLHGAAQLLEHGTDVALLHGALRLDILCQAVGADELLVVDRSHVVLPERLRQLIGVTILLYFLTHFLVSFRLF